jgi:hypothetical protein
LKIYKGASHGMCTTREDEVNADLLAFIQSFIGRNHGGTISDHPFTHLNLRKSAMSRATLMVPGFNGGDPVKLVRFEVSSALRAPGGGRTGRLAD